MTSTPVLAIFDIDLTLLPTELFVNAKQVLKNLYDSELLTKFFEQDFQVAIASFNSGVTDECLCGRTLARAIMDVQHPSGDSQDDVEDEFIQTWLNENYWYEGKNRHILNIITAYKKKYHHYPPQIILYDDNIHNVYLANRSGLRISAYWCPDGLTQKNIGQLLRIGYYIEFSCPEGFTTKWNEPRLSKFLKLIKEKSPVLLFYLPDNPEYAKFIHDEFFAALNHYNIQIKVFNSVLPNF
jgi:hypothetical protein